MKTKVNQIVVDHSERFLKNIEKALPDGVKTFDISEFSMKRAGGNGSFNYVMEVTINGESKTLKQFTHSAPEYDAYTDLEYKSHSFNNWVKSNVLYMLAIDSINDEIYEIANAEEC